MRLRPVSTLLGTAVSLGPQASWLCEPNSIGRYTHQSRPVTGVINHAANGAWANRLLVPEAG